MKYQNVTIYSILDFEVLKEENKRLAKRSKDGGHVTRMWAMNFPELPELQISDSGLAIARQLLTNPPLDHSDLHL